MQLPEKVKSHPVWSWCSTRRRQAAEWLRRHPVWSLIFLAVGLNLVVECLCRRSIIQGFSYLFTHLFVFLYNALIITLTLSIAFFFPKKRFCLSLISVIWLGLGIANCVLLSYRTTPLAAIDFALLKSVWGIMNIYLSLPQMILIVCGLLAVLVAIVFAWIKSPKQKVRPLRALGLVAAMALSVLLCTNLALTAGAVSDEFGNLADAYQDYGFAYCFSCSIVDRGIDKPVDYSEDRIDQIMSVIGGDSKTSHDLMPNIVFVQLESFFDVKSIEQLTFSEDPVPIFTELKETCASGFLTVPSIGAGTANTEFEVITGMSLDYFGTGEYPYKTILRKTACETVCYDLRELGYASHAIHNHSGTFYDRHIIFSSLGFDTFTSLEYMQNVETNPLGWAKDYVLTSEIIKALDSTPDMDLVYAISVQAHGKYPSEVLDPTQHITVSGLRDDIRQPAFEYYINQLHETDAFVGALVSALSNYEEPTILVLYGDHLPSFDIDTEQVSNGNLFQTEYVIWNNFGMVIADRDLYAYQLYSHVLDCLGFDNGVITKLHQRYSNNPNYLEALEMLEYDMLYGEHDIYDGSYPYVPTDLQMGVEEIVISDVRTIGGSVYVYGGDFTHWSVVCINGKQYETTYVSSSSLLVADQVLEPGECITVAQIGDDGEVLSSTGEWTVPGI